jgi:hypothetical protein
MDQKKSSALGRTPAKEALAKAMEVVDRHNGPRSITGKVTEEQAKEAGEVLVAGKPLYGLYSRLSEEDVRRIATAVADRQASIMAPKLTARLREMLIQACVDFSIGLMAAATWDILKLFVPYLHNMFMAEKPTEDMKQIANWEKAAQDVAPPEMRGFADENVRALNALRVQAWRPLRDTIESTELATVLQPQNVTDLMETLESRLFIRGAV